MGKEREKWKNGKNGENEKSGKMGRGKGKVGGGKMEGREKWGESGVHKNYTPLDHARLPTLANTHFLNFPNLP